MLETLVDAANDAMFAVDGGGRIVLWNRGAERMTGYSAEDVLDGALPMLFPDDLRAAADTIVTGVLAGDRVDWWETTFERDAGMPVPVSLSLHPVFDTDGTPSGAVVIAIDTTEQRLAQELLAESEARLQEGEALAHVGRWLWDVPSGTVQWSEEFHRIHGVDPLEFEGTIDAHLRCVVPEQRDRVRARSNTQCRPGGPSTSTTWSSGPTTRADGCRRAPNRRSEHSVT